MELFALLYAITTLGLAIYGFNALLFALTFLWLRWRRPPPPPLILPAEWPTVTVQLPIYNERFVVERLIESVAALDYPPDRLAIQVLDDSTDDTVALARAKVAHCKARGLNIEYIQRPDRSGFKAGALAYGLQRTTSELVAVFDADFVPPPDFLRRMIPTFTDERVGMVQARWGHLNAEYSSLTRAQAIMLDGHFGLEQVVRNRIGLLMNFNGSAGVWRRQCILDAGGWQADTIAEDLDLSYRAQLRGWKLRYRADVVVPAEIPTLLGAFKRQQSRWAKGSIQTVRKVGWQLVTSSSLSSWHKLQGLLHLTGYLVHPLMAILILISLPLVMSSEVSQVHLGAIGLGGFGAPMAFAVAQWTLYPDWRKRLQYLPALVLLGAGIAASNSWAFIEALIGRNPTLFLRTPKLQVEGRNKKSNAPGSTAAYGLPIDWTTWADIFLMLYCFVTAIAALKRAPGLAPFMLVYTVGFGYTAFLALKQSLGDKVMEIKGLFTTE